jgi:hypothetical protein
MAPNVVAANAGNGDELDLHFDQFSEELGRQPCARPTNGLLSPLRRMDATLVAADSGYGDGLIYASTNAGVAWAPTTAPVEYWTSVASSADGSKLAASGYPGGIYTWQSLPVLNIASSRRETFHFVASFVFGGGICAASEFRSGND